MKIIDFNHCNLPKCKCGWNITLAGKDEDELKVLKEAIYNLRNVTQDLTSYPDKINGEVFIDIPATWEKRENK